MRFVRVDWQRRALLILASAAGLLAMPGAADDSHAAIYWGSAGQNVGVGRAANDGTIVDTDFIAAAPAGALAIDDEHIYFATADNAIARADLDGLNVDPDFIPNATITGVSDIAVTGSHIYWSRVGDAGDSWSSIARASIDGTNVDLSFVDGIDNTAGIAIDEHLYWLEREQRTGCEAGRRVDR